MESRSWSRRWRRTNQRVRTTLSGLVSSACWCDQRASRSICPYGVAARPLRPTSTRVSGLRPTVCSETTPTRTDSKKQTGRVRLVPRDPRFRGRPTSGVRCFGTGGGTAPGSSAHLGDWWGRALRGRPADEVHRSLARRGRVQTGEPARHSSHSCTVVHYAQRSPHDLSLLFVDS